MASRQGRFEKLGLSSVRRDWNVLKAVRKFRGNGAPSWPQYLTATNKGRKKYSGRA